MSGGRPASLDGSLLARKGAATPAIPDESPLVLQFDEHHPEPDGPEPGPEPDGPAVGPENNQQSETAGLATAAGKGLSRVIARLAPISSRVRLMLGGVVAVAVVAILWPSDYSGGTSQVDADSTAGAVPVAEANSPDLKLNLTAAPEVPEKPAESPNPQIVAVAMPGPVELAVGAASNGAASNDAAAMAEPVITKVPAAPASGSVILANVTSRESAPPVGSVDPSPEISTTLPKSVSPVPVPRAKPDLAAAPAGRYAVQLASIAVEKRANAEAFRLQKHLGRILSGHEIRVEKAVVKGKGTMYRLRANGYRSYAEARAACTQVVRLKVNCLAIRR